ncbi:MAG: LPS-assembly protein LptD [Acidobacteria bacterium]|mgnify:CR=1 FL=1|nr:MAG: LPS-assembly protein LptD [Acidobacteriota bacterium]REK01758.1 MAG: LPS-assembly protein LptD [Acidobacteriota bacterium]REK14714.1 MAG: LPS-assembly protein LptD [Acidobacteriota bacterium]REK45429.1 MAG: LPS-assembly protein LptD [Acidobacteriota bacterium]
MRCRIGLVLLSFAFLFLFPITSEAQQTNPVEREVANPVSDTPDVNPVAPDRPITPRQRKQDSGYVPEGGGDELVVYSDSQQITGEDGKRIITHEGNVDVRYGIYRLQADKIVIYEETNTITAEGSVVFDQGDDQRITGTSGIWNYQTKLGTFENSTGYTNQTDDGTIIYFTADKVERTKLEEVVISNGVFTACEDTVPKWSFKADKATVVANDKLKLSYPRFRIKNIPVLALPYVSIPIKERARSSGFLTPTFGFSANKGFRFSGAYYQTLGKSADATFRGDLFTGRGIGYGVDVRTRANSRSYFNFGLYGVADRVIGPEASAENPDQGGTSVYAEGIHYFANGFVGVADVRITSSLAFRQVFFDGIQQITSPIETSEAFVNKSWRNYTLNILARSNVTSIPNVRVKTRYLPSIEFEKRPSELSFFENVYFSFKTSVQGISRRDDADSIELYRQATGGDPIVTPVVGQRFDLHPELTLPIDLKYLSITAKAGGRFTYYSNSIDKLQDMRRVVGSDLLRKYGEFELDVRPVALARNFYGKKDSFKFRHVIEPYLTYRFRKGINEFEKIIRYDYEDTETDTNEVEYGITNRFFVRRYTEAVTDDARDLLKDTPDSDKDPLSIQPYEIFTLTIKGKYYFDPYFGGALQPGERNQIKPITDLTFYTFGGVPRRFSPINIDATYRPLNTIFFNSKMDVGVQGDGLRNISATVGYNTKLLKIFQTFYYTRAVTLIPSLRQFANDNGKEAGTLRGSQWSPAIFIGDKNRGLYGGTSLFLDFQNRRESGGTPVVSSLYTLGYAFDCCALATQFYTYNVGVRSENRVVFSFRLNGIGAFGTEVYAQGDR